jgi:HK97 family phage major capsid protein
MKWIKTLKKCKATGDREPGAAYEVDEKSAEMLVDTGVAEYCDPPEVDGLKAEGGGDDPTAERMEVRKALREMVGALGEDIRAATAGIRTKSRRPGTITVGDDNALADPTDGFKGLSDFARTVHKACTGQGVDDRLRRRVKASGASENVNADGGYAVPVEYATTVFNDVIAQDSLMNECQTIPMGSNSLKLPALNYTQQGGYGVTAYWEGEGQAIPGSKPAFRQPSLTLNKLTALVPVTSELLEDGIAVESLINVLAGEAITFKINDAIFNGTGAGMPVGIIGHASTVSVAKEAGQAANTIVKANVQKARQAFYGNRKNAKFYINQDAESALFDIKDDGGRALYFAPGSFSQTPDGKLLGHDVKPTYVCQTLGTAGDLVFTDLKQYVFGYKSTGVNKAMSIRLYFASDEVAYRWTFRADGRPWRDATLAAAKGSAVYGSAATIATRA